jgi:hypothetical protein
MDGSEGATMHAVPGAPSSLKLRLLAILATALSVVAGIGALGSAQYSAGMAPPRPPIEADGDAAIVVEADVEDWATILSPGAIDPAKPDRPINVVDDAVIIGEHNWIVRLRVARVVKGAFEPDEVLMLVHSPSQLGVRAAGQRMVLGLGPRSGRPRVITAPSRRWKQASFYLRFSDPFYELIWAQPRPSSPSAAR